MFCVTQNATHISRELRLNRIISYETGCTCTVYVYIYIYVIVVRIYRALNHRSVCICTIKLLIRDDDVCVQTRR